jgi:hypothetical protein
MSPERPLATPGSPEELLVRRIDRERRVARSRLG